MDKMDGCMTALTDLIKMKVGSVHSKQVVITFRQGYLELSNIQRNHD